MISLLYACTCFEHYVLIIRMSKLYYTASGTITPVGGRPVHMLRRDWRYQMPYNTILTSWWWTQQCSKHVEECNKSYYKTRICALSWLIAKIVSNSSIVFMTVLLRLKYSFFFLLDDSKAQDICIKWSRCFWIYYPNGILEVMSKTGKNVSIAGVPVNCQECNTNACHNIPRGKTQKAL